MNIEIPPKGERIRAIGRTIWHDFSPREALYYFRVGICLEEMELGDKERWENFIRDVGQREDKGLAKKKIVTGLEEDANS